MNKILNNVSIIKAEKMFVDMVPLQIILVIIYFLVVINLLIFMITIAIKIRDKINEHRFNKMYKKLLPKVKAFLKYDTNALTTLRKSTGKKQRNVIMKIIEDYGDEYEVNLEERFECLGIIDQLIDESKKKLTYANVKWFGLMKIKKAIPLLMNATQYNDYELSYQCFQALSRIPMNDEQLEAYLSLLFASKNLRDRLIEMVQALNLEIEKYYELLLKESKELEKVVFLRVIGSKTNGDNEEKLTNSLIAYLSDSKEVKISAVVTISLTRNNKYFEHLSQQYEIELDWEVRSAISKAIQYFTHEGDIELLKKMTNDPNWWVRYNATEVLARKGLRGIDALIDISLNSDKYQVADMAYSILDANKNIHHTLHNQ